MEIWLVSTILVATLVLLITERIPVDLTAVGIIVALSLTGILSPGEAVAGLANPAVVTVGAMFILSQAMIRTGAIGVVAQMVIRSARGNARRAMLIILLVVGLASALINNTPVVVLFIPILLTLSCEYQLSPSTYLIPVSYASILAGTCTLIGTSTNIIISDLSAAAGIGALGMFELAAAGVPIALAGIAFLYLVAPTVMPGHAPPTCELHADRQPKYLAELRVPRDSPLIGAAPLPALQADYPSIELFEIVRGDFIHYPDREALQLRPGDLLLVKGSASDLVAILQQTHLELPHRSTPPSTDASGPAADMLVVELIVPPQSSLVGAHIADSGLLDDPAVQPIAVKRRRVNYRDQRLRNLTLRVGDIVLMRCPQDRIDPLRRRSEVIIVEDVHQEIVHRSHARRMSVIFGGVVLAAAAGVADIMVCAVTGVLLTLLSGCINLRDAYRALQARVLLLIVGALALGEAMQVTGAAEFYAQRFLALFDAAGPHLLLAAFMLLASLGTQVLSNNATAILLMPIGLSTAAALGVDPRPFVVGLCFGASACFATPIGYQTNLLVYGPGGYRFSDYLRLGLPLNLLVLGLAVWLVPVFWPF